MKRILHSKHSYNLLLIGVMLLLIMLFSALTPFFFTAENFKNVLNQASMYIFLTLGMTFVIASGQIDLSVGAIIGFVGMAVSNFLYHGMSAIPAIFLGLIVGTLLGALNGVLVAYLRINSFIVTLCSMTIMRGIIILIMNSKNNYGFGPVLGFIGAGKIGMINMPILMALIAVAVSAFLLNLTKFGSYTLFLGTNEIALSRSGVNTRAYRVIVFSLSGLMAAIAGIIIMGRLDSVMPLAGQGYEMDAIAAVILGGVMMSGGKASISGPFIACIIMSIIKAGLTLVNISPYYQQIITGIIILVSVLISGRDERRRMEV